MSIPAQNATLRICPDWWAEVRPTSEFMAAVKDSDALEKILSQMDELVGTEMHDVLNARWIRLGEQLQKELDRLIAIGDVALLP